nr:hypothetical protein OH820_27495 [Streptomyces sp. NBC_00857]
MDQKLSSGTRKEESEARKEEREQQERRLDLNLPQVAGSALAAVAAAVLASQLGVYGTIIGAGVVSVVATCGGSVFQHLFRRTGEQIRVVTVQAKPGGRQVPVPHERDDPGRYEQDDPVDMYASGDPPGRSDPSGRGGTGDPYASVDATGLPRLPRGLDGEFTEATTHGSRVRGWKRPVRAAATVFLVAMIGITGYEVISGQDLSGGKGTTVGSAVRGGGERSVPSDTPSNSQDTGVDPDRTSDSPTSDDGSGSGSGTDPSASPDTGQSADTGQSGTDDPSRAPSTAPSGSADGKASQTPTPTPSGTAGDSGTGDSGTGNSGADDSGSGATTQGTDSGSGSDSGTADR